MGAGTLWLTFCIRDRIWGIRASAIREVLPFVELDKPPSGAPPWLRGFAAYRGARLPVADVSRMAGGPPAAAHMSTRILVVQAGPDDSRLAGLLAEQATDARRIPAQPSSPPPEDGLPEWTDWLAGESGKAMPVAVPERLPIFRHECLWLEGLAMS